MSIVNTWTVAKRGTGLPDYTQPRPAGQISTDVAADKGSGDVAELAVRLKSADFFDRRGNVCFLDDFENGISKWGGTFHQTAWESQLDRTIRTHITGGFGYHVWATAGIGNLGNAFTIVPYPSVSVVGYEWCFAFDNNVDYFYMDHRTNNFNLEHRPWVWYCKTATAAPFGMLANNLYVATTGMQLMRVCEISLEIARFHVIKLTANMETGMYEWITIDGQAYDLSTIECMHAGGPGTPQVEEAIQIYNNDAADPANLYLNHFILTTDEKGVSIAPESMVMTVL